MKLTRIFLCAGAGIILAAAGLFAAGVQSTNETVTSPPVYVPDTSHANDPLPDGVLAWSSLIQNVAHNLMLNANVPADAEQAHFLLGFTNVSSGSVSILDVHTSCGCTTADLPPRPWTIPAGGSGQFPVTVNLNIAGREGTLIKSVTISTDKGSKEVLLRIAIQPPVFPTMTEADRARGVAMSKLDRQAIFKGDCATCHIKSGEGKYGKALFDAVCSVCHETEHRATFVPDLHSLKIPTNDEFWRTWIAHGKPGSLMPAFSSAEGGPFNDMQIASLAAYLNYAIPSHVFPPPPTNAPPAQ